MSAVDPPVVLEAGEVQVGAHRYKVSVRVFADIGSSGIASIDRDSAWKKFDADHARERREGTLLNATSVYFEEVA